MNQAPAAQGGLTSEQINRLNQRFRNKHDLYAYMDRVMQIYLPKEKNCSIQFLQDLLNNRKRFFRKYEQRNLRLPLWPELSIQRILPEALLLPRFQEYLPQEWSVQNIKKIDRGFMFGILITLVPDYVEQLVLDIRSQRMNQMRQRGGNQQQVIGVSQEWVDHLLNQPFQSSQSRGGQSILIQRNQPVNRRQAPPRQVIQSNINMTQYIAFRQQNGDPVQNADPQYRQPQPQVNQVQQQQQQPPANQMPQAMHQNQQFMQQQQQPANQLPQGIQQNDQFAQQQQQQPANQLPQAMQPNQQLIQNQAQNNLNPQVQEEAKYNEQQIPRIDEAEMRELENQIVPNDHEDWENNHEASNLNRIEEANNEDQVSQSSDTQLVQNNRQNPNNLAFVRETQAIGNQLELASMASDYNSVINTSPIKQSRHISTRKTKNKKNDQ